MSPFTLSLKSLRNRKFTVALTVLSLALGVALLLGVERIRREARTSFTNTLSGTDLIVGARTSEVPLLLSTVFRIGNPTTNISWESYRKIADNPRVAWTIPISLGDSHRGYRVLGTNTDYFAHYRHGERRALVFAQGAAFSDVEDAVLGSEVARALGYGIGDAMVLAHGAGEMSFVEHDEHPFRVVGILKPTGTPVDRTVHVSLEGIEAVHEGMDGAHAGHNHAGHNHGDKLAAFDALLAEDESTLQPDEITAFFVGMHSRADAVFLQRSINTYEGEALSAAMPGVALQELWQVTGVVERALQAVSMFVVIVSLAGMLATLVTGLNERRREMAILRSVGARPLQIVGLIAGEALAVTVLAIGVGMLLLYGLLWFARPLILEKTGLFLRMGAPSATELALIGIVLMVGLVVGLLPAWHCYRRSLADGLMVRI